MGKAVGVWGQVVYGKSLYLQPSFVVNLILLKQTWILTKATITKIVHLAWSKIPFREGKGDPNSPGWPCSVFRQGDYPVRAEFASQAYHLLIQPQTRDEHLPGVRHRVRNGKYEDEHGMNMDFEGLMACQHRHKQVISTQWTKRSDRGSRGIVEHRGEGQLIQRGTKKEEKGFLEEISSKLAPERWTGDSGKEVEQGSQVSPQDRDVSEMHRWVVTGCVQEVMSGLGSLETTVTCLLFKCHLL